MAHGVMVSQVGCLGLTRAAGCSSIRETLEKWLAHDSPTNALRCSDMLYRINIAQLSHTILVVLTNLATEPRRSNWRKSPLTQQLLVSGLVDPIAHLFSSHHFRSSGRRYFIPNALKMASSYRPIIIPSTNVRLCCESR